MEKVDKKVVVDVESLPIYDSPQENKVLAVAERGDKFHIDYVKGNWGRIGRGWINLKHTVTV